MAENFHNAFLRTQPSVSAADREFYISMKDRLCKARAHPSSSGPDDGESSVSSIPPVGCVDGRGGGHAGGMKERKR